MLLPYPVPIDLTHPYNRQSVQASHMTTSPTTTVQSLLLLESLMELDVSFLHRQHLLSLLLLINLVCLA